MSYDLSIVKTVDQGIAQSGDIITYTIEYYLSGANQNNIIIQDFLPDGIEFLNLVLANPIVSYHTGTTLTFSGISLIDHQTGNIIFEALVTT